MRLPLPPDFPSVDVPLELAASAVITRQETCLPGTELLVFLPNNYGLLMINGRPSAYCGKNTVEVVVLRMVDRDAGVWVTAHNTPVRTTSGPGMQGWADAVWLADALTTLARL